MLTGGSCFLDFLRTHGDIVTRLAFGFADVAHVSDGWFHILSLRCSCQVLDIDKFFLFGLNDVNLDQTERHNILIKQLCCCKN